MNAQKYDSVTIYFSDLVDFIQMVEESTPAEVKTLSDSSELMITNIPSDGDLPKLLLQNV